MGKHDSPHLNEVNRGGVEPALINERPFAIAIRQSPARGQSPARALPEQVTEEEIYRWRTAVVCRQAGRRRSDTTYRCHNRFRCRRGKQREIRYRESLGLALGSDTRSHDNRAATAGRSPAHRTRGTFDRRIRTGLPPFFLAAAGRLRHCAGHTACIACRDPRQAQCNQNCEQTAAHSIACMLSTSRAAKGSKTQRVQQSMVPDWRGPPEWRPGPTINSSLRARIPCGSRNLANHFRCLVLRRSSGDVGLRLLFHRCAAVLDARLRRRSHDGVRHYLAYGCLLRVLALCHSAAGDVAVGDDSCWPTLFIENGNLATIIVGHHLRYVL